MLPGISLQLAGAAAEQPRARNDAFLFSMVRHATWELNTLKSTLGGSQALH